MQCQRGSLRMNASLPGIRTARPSMPHCWSRRLWATAACGWPARPSMPHCIGRRWRAAAAGCLAGYTRGSRNNRLWRTLRAPLVAGWRPPVAGRLRTPPVAGWDPPVAGPSTMSPVSYAYLFFAAGTRKGCLPSAASIEADMTRPTTVHVNPLPNMPARCCRGCTRGISAGFKPCSRRNSLILKGRPCCRLQNPRHAPRFLVRQGLIPQPRRYMM